MESTLPGIKGSTKTQTGMRNHAIFTLGALVLQFVLGMLTNLFVSFPSSGGDEQLWAAARSQIPSAAHIFLGILLLVNAIIFLIRAANKNRRGWLASAAVGFFSILTAFYGGVTFIPTQADAYSLVMALGFIAAFVAYGWGLYANRG